MDLPYSKTISQQFFIDMKRVFDSRTRHNNRFVILYYGITKKSGH